MTTSRVSKSHYLVLFAIVLLTAALRLPYLEQPMRYDEALTFRRYASQPLQTVISSYDEPNNHVFHSVLVHAAYSLFGNDPAVLRLPAFIAGILLIVAVYGVTRAIYQPRAGLLAAALCAVSLPLIEFSVNARGYTLLALFAVLLLGIVRRLKDHSTLGDWLAFIIVSALGFYTIPVMLYPFGIAAVWLVLSYAREEKGWRFFKRVIVLGIASLLAAALTLLLYAPIIAGEGIEALTQNQFVASPSAFEFYQRLPEIFGTLFGFPLLGFPALIALALAAGSLLALFLHRHVGGVGVSPGWAALLWLLAVLFIQRVVPFDRTWTAITPLVLMLAAAGITYLFSRSDQAFTVALLVLVAPTALGMIQSDEILTSERTGYAPDAEAAALWLGQNRLPEDIVLIPSPLHEPVRYYLGYHGFPEGDIRNEHQTYWIDLLQGDVGSIYVFGIEEGDVDNLVQTFLMPAPSFNLRLDPVETYSETTLQTLAAPEYPAGTLFAADFESGVLFSGWTLSNVEAELVKSGGNNTVLRLTSVDNWSEMNLSGALDWHDYAVQMRVQVLTPAEQAEDIYVHIRSRAEVGSYIAGFDIEEGRAYIAGDANREWRGFLAQTPMPLETGQWYTLRFTARGSTITLEVDGEQVITLEDDVADAGAVRVLIAPHSQILIDDMLIAPVDR